MAVHYSQFQQKQQQQLLFGMASVLAGGSNQALVPPPQVFSEPVSELTCNISGSRKRAREGEPLMQPTTATSAMLMYQQQQQLMLQKQYQQRFLLQNQIQLCKTQLHLPVENSRLNQSIMASTSGRPTQQYFQSSNNTTTTTTLGAGLSTASSTLISLLNQQSLEVDDLVRLHTNKLASDLDDARKRQCRAFMSAVAQHAHGGVAEKQAELDDATKKNAELQERLRQAASESRAWSNVARSSEVVIASLRDSLEQALLENLSGGDGDDHNCSKRCVDPQIEGYGDSEEEAVTTAAENAASSEAAVPCLARFTEVSKPAAKKPRTSTAAGIRFSPCKSCGAADVCVLVLPCRHLCLCPSCEPSADECPVCRGRKNGSVQINRS